MTAVTENRALLVEDDVEFARSLLALLARAPYRLEHVAYGADATVRAEAADEENLRRIQELVGNRLETMGRRDNLKVSWRRPETPPTHSDAAPAVTKPRRHLRTILLIAAGVVAVAAHLGLGGAVLASWRWTGWAADLILAVVVLKVLAVVVVGVRRHTTNRRSRP
jgi:hypothetical protein